MSDIAAEDHQYDRAFFGHPRGLSTLFFTELWERFSYYGMRALLLLFMTDTARHGFGWDTAKSAAVYGLYTFGVYAVALPGGWIADRILGQKKSVLYGGIIIALGHYTLALPALIPSTSVSAFYVGLFLIVMGTGLLKPNVSAIVGELYPEGGGRRDAGFSIFYMGINIGAFAGPLICSYLGEKVDWHLGFSAAGIGMTFGLIQYVYGWKFLHGKGELGAEQIEPKARAEGRLRLTVGVGIVCLVMLFVAALKWMGIVSFTLVSFVRGTGVSLIVLAVLYFAYMIFFACRTREEKSRVFVIFLLFLGAAMFWSGFEQAGSSMNLFAKDFTNRVVLGWEAPAGYLQSVNPLFIVLLAPVIGSLWVKLGASNPSIPTKFAMGLVLLGVGFLVMAWGSQYIQNGKVSPMWLVTTYFFHTVGELCLSPVGLSSITKLSPQRLVSQMMGTWFLGAALGNLIAGLVAGYIDELPKDELFGVVAAIVITTGLLFFIFHKPIDRMCHGIK
jgi:POT family proton-dependent oligopeptide transporter